MSLAALVLGVTLSWSAPAGCPDEGALRADVESLLGRSLSEPFARWVDVHAVVERRSAKFVLELSGDGSGGPFVRKLEDVSCRAIADAAALIIALAIDPQLLESPPPEPPPPTKTATIAPPPPPPIEFVDPNRPTDTSDLPFGLSWPRVGLSLLGGYERGVRPTPGWGLLAAGALLWDYLRLEVIGGYWLERSVRIASQPSSGADVSLIAVGGRVCPTYPWSIELSVCAGLEFGQLRADPVGLDNQSPGRAFYGAILLGAALAWEPIDFLAVRIMGDGFWSVFRPSYEVAGFGLVHQPSRFGGRGLFGIEVRFF